MATELVHSATSESLSDIDWSKNIGICELVAQDNRQAKDVIKAIKKRLDHKNQKVQLYSVSLLEMLMNNIGEPIHKQVMDVGLLPLLVKLVKKKSDSPVREKIFLLLDATQTSVGGSKGRFPHYYNAFYELVNAGVQFPGQQYTVSSNAPSPGTRQINLTVREAASATANKERNPPPPPPAAAAAERPKDQAPPGSSIIEKATAALEVLREVLDAVNPGNPEAGKDEFTLDLVEQCSFQKQRVMHLVMTSRDERLLSQAIELNEKLGRVLARHDALLYNKPQSLSNSDPIEHKITSPSQGRDFAIQPSSRPNPILNDVVIGHEEDEEDEAEQLSRRMRKGKARAKPEDYDEENTSVARPFGWLDSSTHTNNLHRPLIRPLSQDPLQSSDEPVAKPLINPAAAAPPPPGFSIPPPPSKHMEREKFFQEKKGDSDSLSGRMSGISLHSRNPSSSYSERSFDSCE